MFNLILLLAVSTCSMTFSDYARDIKDTDYQPILTTVDGYKHIFFTTFMNFETGTWTRTTTDMNKGNCVTDVQSGGTFIYKNIEYWEKEWQLEQKRKEGEEGIDT